MKRETTTLTYRFVNQMSMDRGVKAFMKKARELLNTGYKKGQITPVS